MQLSVSEIEISTSIASKSWTRMARGILVLIHVPERRFSNFLVLEMNDFNIHDFLTEAGLWLID